MLGRTIPSRVMCTDARRRKNSKPVSWAQALSVLNKRNTKEGAANTGGWGGLTRGEDVWKSYWILPQSKKGVTRNGTVWASHQRSQEIGKVDQGETFGGTAVILWDGCSPAQIAAHQVPSKGRGLPAPPGLHVRISPSPFTPNSMNEPERSPSFYSFPLVCSVS